MISILALPFMLFVVSKIAKYNKKTALEAETQLNQAKLALASEKFNYLSGLLDLEFAINTKLTK